MDWTGERNGERICSGGKSGYRYQKSGEWMVDGQKQQMYSMGF